MPLERPPQLIWLILGVALTLRVGAAVGVQSWLDRQPGQTFLIEGDANGYWHLAEDLAEGREFAIYEPPRRVLRMPGFPALLAMPIRLCSSPLLPARLLLAIVGTVACGLVYVLGRMLFDPGIGLTAATLVAVSPTLLGFTPLILSETLFATCLLATLVAMAWMVGERGSSSPGETRHGMRPVGLRTGIGRGLLVGGVIGATCYVRPSWLLSAPLFGGAYVMLSVEKGRALVAAMCVVVGAVSVLIPWGLRNERVTGHFVLTTLWMGPSLYDGLSPQATGASDMTFFDRDNLMAGGMSEKDVNHHYTQKAWAFVRANPGRTLELAAIKLWRYFKPWPNAAQFDGLLPAVIIAAFTIPAFLLAVYGWWMVRANFWVWGLAVGPLLYFAALHMVFVSSLRYRLPAEYPLMVMTAVGWRSLLWRRQGLDAQVPS